MNPGHKRSIFDLDIGKRICIWCSIVVALITGLQEQTVDRRETEKTDRRKKIK